MGQLVGNHLVLPFVLVSYSRFFNVTNSAYVQRVQFQSVGIGIPVFCFGAVEW